MKVDPDPTVNAPALLKAELVVVNVRPFWTVKLPMDVTEVRPASASWLFALTTCELVPSSVTEAESVLMARVGPGIWNVPETMYVPPSGCCWRDSRRRPAPRMCPLGPGWCPCWRTRLCCRSSRYPSRSSFTVPLFWKAPEPSDRGWNETLSPWNSRLPVEVLMNCESWILRAKKSAEVRPPPEELLSITPEPEFVRVRSSRVMQ